MGQNTQTDRQTLVVPELATSWQLKRPVKLQSESVAIAINKLKKVVKDEDNGTKNILEILEYTIDRKSNHIPQCYIEILYEACKITPVVGHIQTNSRAFSVVLKSFLEESVNIFEDQEMLDHLNTEAPHIMTMICGIKNFEGSDYLPKCVSSLFKHIL